MAYEHDDDTAELSTSTQIGVAEWCSYGYTLALDGLFGSPVRRGCLGALMTVVE